jgi:hypothetical protein
MRGMKPQIKCKVSWPDEQVSAFLNHPHNMEFN